MIRDIQTLIHLSTGEDLPYESIEPVFGYLGPETPNPRWHFAALTSEELREVEEYWSANRTLDGELFCEADAIRKIPRLARRLVEISQEEMDLHGGRLLRENLRAKYFICGG